MPTLLGKRFYYGWVMVACAFLINAVSSTLNPVVFSFLIGPISDDLGVGRSAVSWSLTLRLVAAGFTGPVIGVLIDRYGTRGLGMASGLLAGGMLIALGFARELWLVFLVFTVSGFAGLGGPVGQLLTQVPIAKWFVVNRGRASSIATLGLAMGTAVLIVVTGWLVEGVGWRGTTMIYGVLVIATVVPVSAVFVRRAPEDMGLHPDGLPHPPLPHDPLVSTRLSRLTTTDDWTVSQAMREPTMWLLLVALTLSGLSLTGVLVHRIDFWRSVGMEPGLVALGTAVDPVVLIFSLLAFGFFADRVPVRYIGVAGMLGFAASALPLIFSSGQTSTIVLHSAIWGFAAGANITLNTLVWPNYFGRRYLGSIRGLVLTVTIAAQGLGAPLFGYLLDAGIAPAYVWTASLVACALSAVLVLIARPPRMRRPADATALGGKPS